MLFRKREEVLPVIVYFFYFHKHTTFFAGCISLDKFNLVRIIAYTTFFAGQTPAFINEIFGICKNIKKSDCHITAQNIFPNSLLYLKKNSDLCSRKNQR